MKLIFDDGDLFGDMSFLDILEDQGIPYVYDGNVLEIHDRLYEAFARRLWLNLTGCSVFGRHMGDVKSPDL